MTYIYYCPIQDQLLLTEYHFGVSINQLPMAFDGETLKKRVSDSVFERFEYIGRV